VHQHGGEEDDSRVEVEHSCHDRDECQQRDQELARAEPRPCEPRSDSLEEPIGGGHLPDQQQPSDEHERCPRLTGGAYYLMDKHT